MFMITTFYEGKSILVTGATGFLGKVLLEKLLCMSPDLRSSTSWWLDDAIIDEITSKVLRDWPNNYTYTKALAEMVVQTEGQNLNMAIVRPSIVGATWQEPFPGWVDSLNGPNALIVAIGKGLIRSVKASPRALTDVFPVDIVVNLILSVGCYTAVHRQESTQIYHCTSGALNPWYLGEIGMQVMATLEKVPLEQAFRIPNANFASSTLSMEYWNAVSHRGPAAIYDLFLLLTGRKPQYLKLMNCLLKTLDLLEYFLNRSWEWSMDNTEMLTAELGHEDQQVFNFYVSQLNWLEYAENYIRGVKQYLLKEDISRIPKVKEHMKKLRKMQYLFNMAFILLTWYLLTTHSQVVINTLFFLVNFSYVLLAYLRESCPLKI